MKKIFIAIVAIASIGFSSCSKCAECTYEYVTDNGNTSTFRTEEFCGDALTAVEQYYDCN